MGLIMQELDDLINFWREFRQLDGMNNIHVKDENFANKYKNRIISDQFTSYETEIINHIQKKGIETKFHSNVLPSPYLGDLKNAKLFLLLLNPGFGLMSYYEALDKDVTTEILNTIYQKDFDKEYPLYLLNPKYFWTAGGQYWYKKLQNFINVVSTDTGKPLLETIKWFAKNTAVLELIPYPSMNIGKVDEKMINSLTSTKLALNFVHKLAQQNDVIIVVMRKVDIWKVPSGNGTILKFEGKKAQKASLNPDLEIGKKVKDEIVKLIKGEEIHKN